MIRRRKKMASALTNVSASCCRVPAEGCPRHQRRPRQPLPIRCVSLLPASIRLPDTAGLLPDDLLHVLDRPGGLWGAVLDVTQPEPLTKGHPLWSHDKVIVTPHLSGYAC